MEQYLYLIVGLVLLLAGGEFLVRGGVSIAGHFKISALVVGVTVVSFGTSAPELAVSLRAALSGQPDISLGNVIGSNISNIGLVLALTVIITPYFVNTRVVFRDWAVMVSITLLFILLLYTGKQLSSIEGIIMLALLFTFVGWVLQHSRKQLRKGNGKSPAIKYSVALSLLMIILSSIALVIGADFLVKGATSIARELNVSERVISVSMIALGTSLPELATSAVAAARKQNEISIGNIIGSNIFNILAILGITSTVKSVKVVDSKVLSFDIWYMLGISVLLFILILPFKGSYLRRWKGVVMLAAYILFLFFVYL